MKRFKLYASLVMCVFCLAVLVVGVYAAITVSFSLNGSLQFYPEGVFLSVNGQVYAGNSLDDFKPIYGKSYTYYDHNFDDSTGEISGNFPMDPWNIGNLSFTAQSKYIKIKLDVTNFSDYEIIGIPTLSGTATTNSNITITDPGYAFAYAGDTGSYELILQLSDSATELVGPNINVSFVFEQPQPDTAAFTYSGSTATLNSSYTNTNYNNVLILPLKDGDTNITTYSSMSRLQQNNVIIPDGATNIPSSTFSSCSNLTSVEIPDSVTTINSSAFSGCSNLTSVEIPSGLTSLSTSAFRNCSKITNIEIPSGVSSIADSTFSGCTSLSEILIPNTVSSIGSNTFYNCSSLSEILIPNTVSSIGPYAFYNCDGLREITIPSNVESVGGYVFDLITNITVKVPFSEGNKPNNWDNAWNYSSSTYNIVVEYQ